MKSWLLSMLQLLKFPYAIVEKALRPDFWQIWIGLDL